MGSTNAQEQSGSNSATQSDELDMAGLQAVCAGVSLIPIVSPVYFLPRRPARTLFERNHNALHLQDPRKCLQLHRDRVPPYPLLFPLHGMKGPSRGR